MIGALVVLVLFADTAAPLAAPADDAALLQGAVVPSLATAARAGARKLRKQRTSRDRLLEATLQNISLTNSLLERQRASLQAVEARINQKRKEQKAIEAASGGRVGRVNARFERIRAKLDHLNALIQGDGSHLAAARRTLQKKAEVWHLLTKLRGMQKDLLYSRAESELGVAGLDVQLLRTHQAMLKEELRGYEEADSRLRMGVGEGERLREALVTSASQLGSSNADPLTLVEDEAKMLDDGLKVVSGLSDLALFDVPFIALESQHRVNLAQQEFITSAGQVLNASTLLMRSQDRTMRKLLTHVPIPNLADLEPLPEGAMGGSAAEASLSKRLEAAARRLRSSIDDERAIAGNMDSLLVSARDQAQGAAMKNGEALKSKSYELARIIAATEDSEKELGQIKAQIATAEQALAKFGVKDTVLAAKGAASYRLLRRDVHDDRKDGASEREDGTADKEDNEGDREPGGDVEESYPHATLRAESSSRAAMDALEDMEARTAELRALKGELAKTLKEGAARAVEERAADAALQEARRGEEHMQEKESAIRSMRGRTRVATVLQRQMEDDFGAALDRTQIDEGFAAVLSELESVISADMDAVERGQEELASMRSNLTRQLRVTTDSVSDVTAETEVLVPRVAEAREALNGSHAALQSTVLGLDEALENLRKVSSARIDGEEPESELHNSMDLLSFRKLKIHATKQAIAWREKLAEIKALKENPLSFLQRTSAELNRTVEVASSKLRRLKDLRARATKKEVDASRLGDSMHRFAYRLLRLPVRDVVGPKGQELYRKLVGFAYEWDELLEQREFRDLQELELERQRASLDEEQLSFGGRLDDLGIRIGRASRTLRQARRELAEAKIMLGARERQLKKFRKLAR